MPVYKVMEEMPHEELLNWAMYFRKRPIGYREDQRTFMLLQAQGYKGTAESLFPTLKLLKEGIPTEEQALPKGVFLAKMKAAVGGDGSDWKPIW
jgi:hypothetical protein